MFTRFFNQALPEPTEEQLNTMLVDKEIGLFSEIISVAYEPRFKLYALGSATGDFHVINHKNYWYSYTPVSPEYPILKIIPLTNSSTFLSVTSAALYENHCLRTTREERPTQINNIFFKPKTILSEATVSQFKSTITHWIVTHDGTILHRPVEIKFNILDFAASPIHPEFVLLLTKTGSIYGFSVEEMKFTDLYIDVFEGKNVHSIICPYALKFYVCHDVIEKINMKNTEVSSGAAISALQIDKIDKKSDYIAAIDSLNREPSLFKGNRKESAVKHAEGSYGTCASMITDKDWCSIVHERSGDSIYSGDQLKIHLEGEFLVPSIIPEYKKPMTRELAKRVNFVTNTGRFVNLTGNSMDHFMVAPIEPKFAFIDKNDNIYVFNVRNRCFVFEKGSFMGSYAFDWGKPLTVLNGFALCVNDEREVFAVNIKTNQKVESTPPIVPSKVVSAQLFENYIDFVCENMKVIRIDLASKEKFEGVEVVDQEELKVCQNYPYSLAVSHWRPFNGTFACIKQIGSRPVLIVDKLIFTEVCEKDEDVVFFEVIDETGRVSPRNSSLILVATTFHIALFAVDEKGLKRVRHVSFSHDQVIEATVTSWGVLIVRTASTVQLLPLPDITHSTIATLNLNYDAPPALYTTNNNNNDGGVVVEKILPVNPIILPNKGLIVFERNLVTIFLREFVQPECFSESSPPEVLVPPPTSGLMKIFGKKSAITVEEADRCFLFKRSSPRPELASAQAQADEDSASSTASSIGNSLAETQALMQELLVKANERGEQLNELEIKAQRLAQSAKEYRKACRRFRK